MTIHALRVELEEELSPGEFSMQQARADLDTITRASRHSWKERGHARAPNYEFRKALVVLRAALSLLSIHPRNHCGRQ